MPDRVAYCNKLHCTVNNLFDLTRRCLPPVKPRVTSILTQKKGACAVVDEAAYYRLSPFNLVRDYPEISSTGPFSIMTSDQARLSKFVYIQCLIDSNNSDKL